MDVFQINIWVCRTYMYYWSYDAIDAISYLKIHMDVFEINIWVCRTYMYYWSYDAIDAISYFLE